MAFKDHFSRQADEYSKYRPRYPRALFEFLAGAVARRECAWDCGTGNGQAAVGLGEFFEQVYATDPSARQIAQAEPLTNVTYLVSAAEHAPIEDASVDLVTVAQALHWFDLDQFYAEVRRVGRPGSILAAWCYALTTIGPSIDRVVVRLYHDIVGPYWPPERKVIEGKYATIAFPFAEITAPEFSMTADWNLRQLVGYLGTWSSVQGYIKHHGRDPIELLRDDFANVWGPPETIRQVRWPVHMRIGRIQ